MKRVCGFAVSNIVLRIITPHRTE